MLSKSLFRSEIKDLEYVAGILEVNRRDCSKMGIVDSLRKRGFEVIAFNEFHHRVNREFDFWKNDKGRLVAWHDRIIGDRGRVYPEKLFPLIQGRLRDRPVEVAKEEFIARLVSIGWTANDAERAWSERNADCELSTQSKQS